MLRALWDLLVPRQREDLFEAVDRLNAAGHGGGPVEETVSVGTLSTPSKSLVLEDPQSMPNGLTVVGLATDNVTIDLDILRYPDGATRVQRLRISSGLNPNVEDLVVIGEIGIDSAKVCIADVDAAAEHWTEIGKDRIGIIKTMRGQKFHRQLKKRFKLKTVQVNGFQAEVVGPVSEKLESESAEYLSSIPEYSKYPFMYFRVQTNDSFDRVNFMSEEWAFIPIGNSPEPLMFACGTGRGDGIYEVRASVNNGLTHSLTVDFMSDDD
ncbi:MAG: hypothetical protein O3B13_06285 [Planctomycetota bacterium]|nr:hypothetical protein [Planctomycetota bacterium]